MSLGRIAGVRVGLNWSWFVVFALVVWTLAAAVFPAQNPGLSEGAYVAMAVAAAVLFFVSVLLHELGHAVQARRDGLEIDRVTLWLFGGVAKFRGSFPTAGAEFRIALAGPLVTLVIAAACLAGSALLDLSPSVDGVVAWLGYINLVLLVFNLLPALPLDGGRLFRAALWKTRGDLGWATRVAAGIGRAFGFVFVAGGIALLIVHGTFSGAWLAFIGWFLLQAASAESRHLVVREVLEGEPVSTLMEPEPTIVEPDLTIGRFLDEVAWINRHATYPVVTNGRAVGLLSMHSIARVPRSHWDTRRVRDCMLPRDEVPGFAPDTDLAEALAKLVDSDVHRGLVLEGDRLAGLLSISDVARALEVGALPAQGLEHTSRSVLRRLGRAHGSAMEREQMGS